MKIAQIAPLYEAVPPRLYGGTERVISQLTDALVEQGHQVTLFASADARTRAAAVSTRAQALRLDPVPLKSELAAHLSLLHEVRRRAHEFDVLHFHTDMLHFSLFQDVAAHTVTTLHGRLDIGDLPDVYRRFSKYPLVSISDGQRKPLPDANWIATVHHGIHETSFQFQPRPPGGGHLVFLGRMSPEKRPDRAIAIAKATGVPLKMAAKVDDADREYFEQQIRPLLEHPLIEFIGEIGEAQKNDFLGHARALLFPVDWPEPFGLSMIEAMACGTPVIAWDCGSVPEIVEEGVNGRIVNSLDEAVAAVRDVSAIDRSGVRASFERRFTAGTMGKRYAEIYGRLLQGSQTAVNPPPLPPAPPVARSPQRLFVLKEGDTFLVADAYGDVTGDGDGLFHNDTRLLSAYMLRMDGRQPTLLSSAVSQDNAFFTASLTNHPLPQLGDTSAPEGVLHLERRRFLWHNRIHERITLTNYGDKPARVPLQLRYAADFRDMFEVRGSARARRGELAEAQAGDKGVALRYQGLDEVWRHVYLSFSEAPLRLDAGEATFEIALAGRGRWELYTVIGPEQASPDRASWRAAAARARVSLRVRRRRGARVRTPSRLFHAWIEKSEADLALLSTELPTGPYPYAGIPWFSTPFGRDAVITALQTLWIDPALARGVLAFLAAHQARETSSFRDAEPGKIMHETRKGEMAAVNELPFGQYYGGVDTTPLFVMLASAYATRTGDVGFIAGIRPALKAAADWIQANASRHGGFLSYARGETSGLANQGWKDSHDSVFHMDGSTPEGPIALVEVQGYAWAAYGAMASLARLLGDVADARHWEDAADTLRTAVETRFWQDDLQFYALALDGHGQPCRVRSSNAGHLLYCGLPSPERGRAVARQLLAGAFDTGWGVRTLARETARYNPMSYHNGSVWPHDVALCAAGLARYGERAGVVRLLGELFEASTHFGLRLPELFCGFGRAAGEPPVAYPVACLPQAWAAGSVFMLLQACLGVTINAVDRTVLVDRPRLPSGMETMHVRGIAMADCMLDLTFQRMEERIVAFAHQPVDQPPVLVDLRL